MAASAKTLFPRIRFKPSSKGWDEQKFRRLVKDLPEPYQKFYGEWKDEDGTPVHWVPSKENWERNPVTGEVTQIKDRPIPVNYPDQIHEGLWGGEGVIEGKVKKKKYQVPVPRYWVPNLQRTVVYSEILDTYISMIVTERALRLIDESYGLDPYLIKNPAYELKSLLALKLKRKLLVALITRDFAHDNLDKQENLLSKYNDYLKPMEELEWYGLSVAEAQAKHRADLERARVAAIVPLKHQYRMELIQKLKDDEIKAKQEAEEGAPAAVPGVTAWLSKLNPFAKPSNLDEGKKRKS